jgi:alkaline phosphatase
MQYEIDRVRMGGDSVSLADMVKAGITQLDNENGFFMMTEGGKIDWSCHANDAMTSIMTRLPSPTPCRLRWTLHRRI